jgi:NADPH-dependent curcumin reductase CurA
MSSVQAVNRRILLARRPEGEPTAEDFRLEKDAVPAAGPGQLLLRTRYLSLDPYMRGRMSDARSYAPPVAVGEPMTGQTVSVVEASRAPGFEVGELVLATAGWQDYAVVDAQRDSPPTWDCWTLGSRSRARLSWWRRPPAPSARSSDSSPGSKAAAPWASPAAPRSANTP